MKLDVTRLQNPASFRLRFEGPSDEVVGVFVVQANPIGEDSRFKVHVAELMLLVNDVARICGELDPGEATAGKDRGVRQSWCGVW